MDAFSCIEERLDYIRRNQKHLRLEIYKGIKDTFVKRDNNGNAIRKELYYCQVLLTAQDIIQNILDAMAICKCYEHPDLFIMFTCNA